MERRRVDTQSLSEILTTAGAFLSGFGSVLTAWLALRYERQRSKEECEERFASFRAGYETHRTGDIQ
jgi:hypothetical protein